jgi:hypothetical protein
MATEPAKNPVVAYSEILRVYAEKPPGMSQPDFDAAIQAAQPDIETICEWARDRCEYRLQNGVLSDYNCTVTLTES